MTTQGLNPSHSDTIFEIIRRRLELLVPILGVPFLFAIFSSNGTQVSPAIRVMIYVTAALHAAIVIVRPMSLPRQEIQPIRKQDILRTALWIVPAVIVLIIISSLFRSVTSQTDSAGGSFGKAFIYFAVICLLSIAGTIASRRITVDLFPLFHKFDLLRAGYVLVASLYLAIMIQIAGSLAGSIGGVIASIFGQPSYQAESAASLFNTTQPFQLFISLLIGAGIFEELIFRVGLLTIFWAVTRRFWIGMILSSLIFAVYHITFSSISSTFQQFPIATLFSSFGTGIAAALIYRYRGFESAVAAHAIGDWLIIMLLNG